MFIAFRQISDTEFELLEPVHATVLVDANLYTICVPAGFKTDLASVPRFLWGKYPPFGSYTRAAIIHDYLYSTRYFGKDSRKLADKIFREVMKLDKVPESTILQFYRSVRWWGWIVWGRHTKKSILEARQNIRLCDPIRAKALNKDECMCKLKGECDKPKWDYF